MGLLTSPHSSLQRQHYFYCRASIGLKFIIGHSKAPLCHKPSRWKGGILTVYWLQFQFPFGNFSSLFAPLHKSKLYTGGL